jgi:hypothetical protein
LITSTSGRRPCGSGTAAAARRWSCCIWRQWADDIVGMPIKSGHHMAEENPVALAGALAELLRR